MIIRKPMTKTEIRLFKEKVIRDYKLRYNNHKKSKNPMNQFAKRLRRIVPINIAIGTVAMIIFVIINGWTDFFHLLLTGIIWITMISTVLSAIGGKN